MKNPKLQIVSAGAALVTVLCSLSARHMAYADDHESPPPVVPPDVCAFDANYTEWSIQWMRWAAKLPANHHPLFDTADISAGQTGDVWFIGGKFCAQNLAGCSGIDVRTNTIPEGKALFFPIINDECSLIEGLGTDYPSFRNCAQGVIDLVANVECDIDGEPVAGLDNPGSPYRVVSPLFTYTLAANDNIWAATGETVGDPPVPVPGGTTPAVQDGYWIFVDPLPPGRHLIHFHGEIPNYGIVEDITYHLTVGHN